MSKFLRLQKYKGNDAVVTADNTVHPVEHVGDLTISPMKGGSKVLENVYHVPGMKKNLVSVPQITAAGHYVLFGPEDVKVLANADVRGDILMEGRKVKKLYVLSAGTAYIDKTCQHETADLWHGRLAHVNYNRLKAMMKKEMVRGLPCLEMRNGVVCAGCQFGKAHRQPFGESKVRATRPLELIHSSIFSWSILHSPSSIRASEHWDSNDKNAPLLHIHNSYRISSAEPFLISFAASSAGLALQTDGVTTFSLTPPRRSPPLRSL